MEENKATFFQQAKEAFDTKDYSKALKFFEESFEKEKNQAASIYINKCKRILGQTNNNPPPNATEAKPEPAETTNNTTESEPNMNSTNSEPDQVLV
jgi:hypothetical protein